MTKKFWIIFILIVLIASFFRIYNVTQIPPGINRDEGSIAYTAYSLIKVGTDEYGKSYPVSFQSFGDWKLPLYMYMVAPMVAVFGLTELAVRLPSVLAGVGTVIVLFFLIRELFKKDLLAFLSIILIAISPWHIHLSRVESESNMAVFFISTAVLLFLKGIKNYNWLLVPSAIFFALTYYTYAGNYVFTTLLVIGLIGIYYRFLPKNKWTVISCIVFILLSGYIFSQTLLSANKTKLSGIGIFGDPSAVHAKIEIPRNQHEDPSFLLSRLFHNRVVFAVERITQNYISSFSPEFLFIKGGTNNAHNIQNFGNMYLVESLFFFLGVGYLFISKKGLSEKLVLWWLIVAPVASSITKDAPHTNRMFAIFPILPLITAFGLYVVIVYLRRYKYQTFILIIITFLFVFNVGLYVDKYFIHFPKNESYSWGEGYKSLASIVEADYKDKKIIMTRPQYSPYIFLLFYSHYDPKKYISEAKRYPITDDGFVHVKNYGNYEFREIDWSKDINADNTLLVADPSEVPDFIRSGSWKKSEIVLPSGKIMFVLIDTKK